MNLVKTTLLCLPAALLVACGNPADNVPQARVGASTNGTESTAVQIRANAQPFAIDQSASKIDFVGSKVTGSHDGGFTNFVGEFLVAGGKLIDVGNKVVIDTTSLWSDNNRLTGHLKSPDFFDVTQFPTAIFESTSITHGETNSTVTGKLTLHGVTKSISFPADIKVSNDQVSVSSEFHINRFDFDMKYAGKADDLIREEVVLKLNIVARPGKADFSPYEKSGAPKSVARINQVFLNKS